MRINLTKALRRRAFVTVETAEGEVYIGTLIAADFDSLVAIDSGTRRKPVLLPIADIEEILTVDYSNPHVVIAPASRTRSRAFDSVHKPTRKKRRPRSMRSYVIDADRYDRGY